MKNILLSFSILLISNYGFSQTKPAVPAKGPTSDCYTEWYNAFEKYGTTDVTDGTHEIIIAICKDSKCQCLLGKVDVSGGEIVRYTLYIQQEDGSFEKPDRTLSPKYNNPEGGIQRHINNGMSPAYLTSQDETVYLMFYKNLSKVPKKPKKAPSPAQLNIK